LYLPETDVSAWLPVNTDAAWEKQEVGEKWKAEHGADYNGLAWYRAEFTIDQAPKGKSLALLFGAVDEGATVWINGVLAGEHPFKRPDDWYVPFTIDIAAHVRAREPNVVVVLVEDRAGLGGVWKPVFVVTDE
jgi:beta-galactosidase/beta-glucuronidase